MGVIAKAYYNTGMHPLCTRLISILLFGVLTTSAVAKSGASSAVRLGLSMTVGDLAYRPDAALEDFRFGAAVLVTGELRPIDFFGVKGMVGLRSEAGTVENRSEVGSVEFHLVPIHPTLGSSHPVLEIGFLAGYSNLMTTEPGVRKWAPHLGLQVSVALGPYLWFPTAVRANEHYLVFEGGISFNL